jgi:hypothetical protein
LLHDYGIGFAVLAARNLSSVTAEAFMQLLTDAFVLSVFDAAQEEASINYAIVYISSNPELNPSLMLTTVEFQAGLPLFNGRQVKTIKKSSEYKAC